MSDDPIMQALAEVEAGDQSADPGAGHPLQGEEPDARPEGPLPDAEGMDEGSDEGGFSVLSWAERVPEGSHRDFDKTDWWDPENGGLNRAAFHLSDATSAGAGYPNAVGLVVAVAEEYWSRVVQQQGSSDGGGDGGDDPAPDAETVDPETAEALV